MAPTLEDPAPTRVASPWKVDDPVVRRRRGRLLAGAAAAFVVVGLLFGFPTGREVIVGWVLLFLYAACAGDVRVWRRAVVRDWLPLLGVLFAYDLLRGLSNEIGGRLFSLPVWQASTFDPTKTARAHLTEPLAADKALFGGTLPTEWLQQRLYPDPAIACTPSPQCYPDASWYDLVAVLVYFSHFFVSLALAVVLWAISYQLFRRYVAGLVLLSAVTIVTYVLYPAAPPWMASLNGEIATPIERVAPATLRGIGGSTVNSAVQSGEAYANPVAAIPSLHSAIPMLLLLFCWPLVGRWLRGVLVSYVVLMTFTLVYGGEHYVVDVLVGWLYAALAVAAVTWWSRRRAAPG